MVAKIKDIRPREFIYETFKWKINWFDKAGSLVEAYGTTDTDNKVINMYCDFLPLDVCREVLRHELLHVTLEHIVETLNPDKSYNQNEELLIRLYSPRDFSLFRQNPHLTKFIYGVDHD